MRKLLYQIVYILYLPLLLTITKVKGLNNIPKKTHFILAANHPSFFDGVIIHLLFRFKKGILIRFLAAENMYQNIFFRWNMNLIRCIKVKRKNKKECLDKAIKAIENDQHIGIFPEGKISSKPKNDVRTGAIRLSAISRKPILPVKISSFSWKGIEIIIGKPFSVEENITNSYDKLKSKALNLMDKIYRLK